VPALDLADAEQYEMHGSHEVVVVGPPAAGPAAVYTVPGAVQVEILAVSFLYTASANAATRTPLIQFLDQTGVAFCEVGAPFTITANTASQVTFGVGIVQFGANNAARMGAGIPRLRLEDGLQMSVTANLINVTDTITNVRLFVVKTLTYPPPLLG
jgi:hypothetical protein